MEKKKDMRGKLLSFFLQWLLVESLGFVKTCSIKNLIIFFCISQTVTLILFMSYLVFCREKKIHSIKKYEYVFLCFEFVWFIIPKERTIWGHVTVLECNIQHIYSNCLFCLCYISLPINVIMHQQAHSIIAVIISDCST